jgi:hypothetical protein
MNSAHAKKMSLDDAVLASFSSTLYVAPQLSDLRQAFFCSSVLPCQCTLTHNIGSRDPQLAVRTSLQWSSFYRPVVTRSMCLQRVGIGVPGCPSFASVFVRDFVGRFGLSPAALRSLRRQKRDLEEKSTAGRFDLINGSNVAQMLRPPRPKLCFWKLTQQQLAPEHPCKHLTLQQCHYSFISALKG